MIELTPIPDWQVWLFDAAYPVSRVYFWLLMATGFVLCLRALKKTKAKGFILIAIFFLSPLVDLGLQKLSYQLHRDQIEAAMAKRPPEPRTTRPVSITRNIDFPFFDTLLVVGLFLITRDKKKPAL